MRIVIEIDGEKLTTEMVETPEAEVAPPAALLRAAAALGATSAGAAPKAPGVDLLVADLPREAFEVLGLSPTDAGAAAPTAPPRVKRRKPTKAKRSTKPTRGRRTKR